MALAPAKPENPSIITDKGYALAWVGGPTAEVARFDPVRASTSVLVLIVLFVNFDVAVTYLILAVGHCQLRDRVGGGDGRLAAFRQQDGYQVDNPRTFWPGKFLVPASRPVVGTSLIGRPTSTADLCRGAAGRCDNEQLDMVNGPCTLGPAWFRRRLMESGAKILLTPMSAQQLQPFFTLVAFCLLQPFHLENTTKT